MLQTETDAEWAARVATMSREDRIAEAIAECTECGGREFPKVSDCDGCTAAVDDQIAEEARAASAKGDRIMAITRAIAQS